jgi:hypothetical protein
MGVAGTCYPIWGAVAHTIPATPKKKTPKIWVRRGTNLLPKSYLSYTHNQFSYLKYRQALEIALKAYTARRRKMK